MAKLTFKTHASGIPSEYLVNRSNEGTCWYGIRSFEVLAGGALKVTWAPPADTSAECTTTFGPTAWLSVEE